MFSRNHTLLLAFILPLLCQSAAWSFSLPAETPTMGMMTSAVQEAACALRVNKVQTTANTAATLSGLDNQLRTTTAPMDVATTNNTNAH